MDDKDGLVQKGKMMGIENQGKRDIVNAQLSGMLLSIW